MVENLSHAFKFLLKSDVKSPGDTNVVYVGSGFFLLIFPFVFSYKVGERKMV